jgi:16S rRNA (guanine966-N2)-methyltransferase
VTRIIGGSAGGRRIKAPSGVATRPTSDRVREGLFSAIDAQLGSLVGLRFLDLYAGSGAVGLEAASRGAGVVTLVEHDRRTVALIRENARSLDLPRVDVVAGTVSRALSHPARAPYDVVFLDPPYKLPGADLADVLRLLLAHGWAATGGLVVLERSSRDPEPHWPSGLLPDRARRYGETMLWYGRAAGRLD